MCPISLFVFFFVCFVEFVKAGFVWVVRFEFHIESYVALFHNFFLILCRNSNNSLLRGSWWSFGVDWCLPNFYFWHNFVISATYVRSIHKTIRLLNSIAVRSTFFDYTMVNQKLYQKLGRVSKIIPSAIQLISKSFFLL